MQVSDSIQILSIILEAVIAVFGVLIAVKKKKLSGWFIAITFALFAVFDIVRMMQSGLSPGVQAFLLLLACISMLCATWLIWKEH